MSAPSPPGGQDPDQDPNQEPGQDPGSVGPTGPGPLVVLGAIAAVLGWVIRPLSLRLGVAEPVVTLWSVVVVWLLALLVAALAWRTWRALQRRRVGDRLMEPYQAVNRLVLGKASALVGALLLGGYAGFALAHIAIPATELSGQRLLRGSVNAAGGLALMAAGLWLERACRVRSEPE